MSKKIVLKTVKTSVKSGFNFSKFYFSKPISVVLVTTYATILLLVLSTLGFSKIITPKATEEQGVPSLPNSEPFAFLPADNIEVPELGDIEEAPEEKSPEKEPEKTPEKIATEEPVSNAVVSIQTAKTAETPKETAKTVTAPKKTIKTVEPQKEPTKETLKEVTKETGTEQIYFDNYYAPDPIPYIIETDENLPDAEEERTEEKTDPSSTE